MRLDVCACLSGKKKVLDGLKVEMKVSFCVYVVHFITSKSAETPKREESEPKNET